MNQYFKTLLRGGAAVRAFASGSAADILLLTGAAAISYGAWLIYPPAGYIAGGGLLIAGGVLSARGGS